MDAVAASGIITFLSAGNEFGGATFAGCNTIDSPGDANLPITVASLDKDLGLAIYSSRGYTSDGRVNPMSQQLDQILWHQMPLRQTATPANLGLAWQHP